VKPPLRRTSSTSLVRVMGGAGASTTAICANLSVGLRL
jgi:hypothetical protein